MPTITIDVPKKKELDILEYLSSLDYIKILDRKKIRNKGSDTDQADLQITRSADSLKQKNGKTNKSLLQKEYEKETYPYAPDVIRFDDKIYILSKKLDCNVVFENDVYIITNEFLDITVWGESRVTAEQAFSFTFSALYQNYINEDDVNLSEKAKNIKIKLKNLVKVEYVYEAKEV
jgi:hypothetical protein